MSEYLVDAELSHLTGYSRATEQARWLEKSGIPFRKDGVRIIVSRLHVRSWLEGRSVPVGEQPNWEMLNLPLRGVHA